MKTLKIIEGAIKGAHLAKEEIKQAYLLRSGCELGLNAT